MLVSVLALSYLSLSHTHTLYLLLYTYPQCTVSLGFTHIHTEWQAGQSRDNPNTDPMSPAQLSMCFGVKGSGAGRLGKPDDG